MVKAIKKISRVVYQLPRFTKRTTLSHVSFNIYFRALGPLGSGLVLEICVSHSLLHACMEIGVFASDLPTSAKVDSKEGF